MSEHTPGPWEAVELDGKPVNDPAIMSAKHCLATCWINDIPRKQAAANAVLMAAAPDMLAALQIAHRFLDSHGNGWEEAETLDAIRAAMAKATGAEVTA